jgi:phenylacetate-coenzyme A ligase PaaK-like adenylate-forming protein
MEPHPGVFCSNVRTGEWEPDPEVPGSEMHELVHADGVWAGLARFTTAQEAQAGRLRIAPRRVMAISEPLLPEARAAIRRAWHVPVGSRYGMSEGVFAGFCGHASHLPDDLCLFEPVDAAGRPVPDGVRSQRVYVTNLYNLALPLIRYEVTDEITVLSRTCPCGSAFRRIADPQGRLDDTFTYTGGISIHPHLFRSALGQHQQVIEYQVADDHRNLPTFDH